MFRKSRQICNLDNDCNAPAAGTAILVLALGQLPYSFVRLQSGQRQSPGYVSMGFCTDCIAMSTAESSLTSDALSEQQT